MTQEKESIAKAPSGRVTRTPVGKRNILTVKNKDPNYEYRIVNDVDDRVAQFLEAGYEPVDDSIPVGDKRVNVASSMGSKKQISVGGGTKAVVMRIRKEYYSEDQAAKLAEIKKLENATTENARNGTYGKLELSRE